MMERFFNIRTLETEVGESVGARTSCLQSFRELGPPDLVHLSKSGPGKGREVRFNDCATCIHLAFFVWTILTQQSGTYHYVTGVDASSSASVAAYLNTLTFSLGENQIWFGKHAQWKIHSGIYCAFDAFAKVDVRVLVKIPGSVEAYVIDERGDKRPATEEHWRETYMSAMLRALLQADDDFFYVSCSRHLDPLLADKTSVQRFFDAFENLFFSGPKLGAVSEIQVVSYVSNYLVDGFFKFVELTGAYDVAEATLRRLVDREPEVAGLLCRLLIMRDDEVGAVQEMNRAITANPRDAYLLDVQAKFCMDKKRYDLALDSATRAVNAAPAEFYTWARLTDVYIKRGEYEQALLTLNSCPMFTYHDLDAHRMPQPARVHFPLPTDGVIDELWKTDVTQEQEVQDPSLLRLPAPSLRSTFARAYDLLTEIVSRIGWDQLLVHRSNVFVMENEYRRERAASKKNVRKSNDDATAATAAAAVAVAETDAEGTHDSTPAVNGNGNGNGTADDSADATTALDKPPAASTVSQDGDVAATNGTIRNELRNKRLCERWLDNMFIVLYEDLRVYTVWRTESVHYESQQLPYNKTALEWEILGLVAYRLKHRDEAIEALTKSLELRFSHRALWKLLDYYTEKPNGVDVADFSGALDAVVQLTAWNHRWYTEFSPRLMLSLADLVRADGLVKVQSLVEARWNGQGVIELMEQLFRQLSSFKLPGTDS